MGTKMTKFEEAVYAFALRYASGRHTYAHGLVIDEIIRHLKDFPCPESFLREVELRRGDALGGFVPWDIGEEAEFINLEIQIKAEIERRKVER